MHPASLVPRNVVAEHLSDCMVSAFTAAICLQVERRGHLEVNASEVVECFPEGTDKSLSGSVTM